MKQSHVTTTNGIKRCTTHIRASTHKFNQNVRMLWQTFYSCVRWKQLLMY